MVLQYAKAACQLVIGLSLQLGGVSNAPPAAVAPFDPATMTLSGWYRASYTGLPWTPTASAGTSGSNGNFHTNLNDPSVGTSLNGYDCANFNGSSYNASHATDITSFVTTGAGSAIFLFQGDVQEAPDALIYLEPMVFMDANADFGMTYSTNGLTAFAYDSGGYRTQSVVCNTGAPHLVMMTVDGSNLGVTIDSSAEVTTACGTLLSLTGTVSIGQNYGATRWLNGRIWEIMTSLTKFSQADFDNIKSYVNTRYALSL